MSLVIDHIQLAAEGTTDATAIAHTDPDVVGRWLPAVNERAVGGRTVQMSKPKVAPAAIS